MLIVEDSAGYVFGGFAPGNWELNPKFYGDNGSFLFTLVPRMRVFPSTGYNQNFQYLNLHQQTLPNGLVGISFFLYLIYRQIEKRSNFTVLLYVYSVVHLWLLL